MRIADPGLYALKAAARVAIVVPVALFVGKVAIGDDEVALFASFGSFAFLVFAEFGGPAKLRLGGYLALAALGAGLIALGTACSEEVVLGTAAMAAVAFTVLFAGALTGYASAAQSALLLAFVLPLMLPAEAADIGARIAGWGIAAALSIAAVFLLWPQRPRSVVRTRAARAAEVLAQLVAAEGAPERERLAAEATAALAEARAAFVSLQHRPSGAGGRTAALARLLDDLGWIRRFARAEPGATELSEAFAAERETIEREVPASLRRCAGWLRGGRPGEAELESLRKAHEGLGRAALGDVERLAAAGEGGEERAARELDEVFRLRLLAFSAAEIETTVRRALGAAAADPLELARDRVEAAGRVARAHASLRSVWLRNSLRGALGLSLAVLVAQLADVDHAFWVVLGTMSVLRSSALATGSTIVMALLGTLVGIVVGGLIVVAVEGSTAALWVLLPVVTLLAAYAPRAVSFAAGQAGFSAVVLILFNLFEPSGWEVGLARIEDVAIGAAVSLVVGALFWPRGATAVLRRTVAEAYGRAAAFLEITIAALLAGTAPPEAARREAFAADQMLDATIRDLLSDRSGANAPVDQLTLLQAGASRVRQVAGMLGHHQTLVRLSPGAAGLPRVERQRRELEAEAAATGAWYAELGDSIAAAAPAPEPAPPPDPSHRRVVLEAEPGDPGPPPGIAIAWAGRYLDALLALETPLAAAADALGGGRSGRPGGEPER